MLTSEPPPRTDDQPALAVQLLGTFRVTLGDRPIDPAVWKLRKAAGIVKLLALAPARQLHVEQLMEALWPEGDPDDAANNLRRTLHTARRIFATQTAASPFLQRRGDLLVLGPTEWIATDVAAFEGAAERAWHSQDPVQFRLALDCYAGELLPEDRYEEWVEPRRASLRDSCLALLARLAELDEQRGEPQRAIASLQRLLSLEPAHEEAHVALMRLYAATGQRRRALSQFQQLRDALQRELDVEPDERSQQLYAAILSGHMPPILRDHISMALPAASGAAPLVAGSARQAPTNLPLQPTSFIGRDATLAAVVRLLSEHGAPATSSVRSGCLVTLTGPGGCGKSRLATEVAGRLLRDFPDGVWLAELSGLSDPSLLPLFLTGNIPDIRTDPTRSSLELLIEYLDGKHTLLVLDNCEHLIEACAALATAVLRACPAVVLLATSREAMRLPGEQVWPVPPLTLPGTEPASPEVLLGSEAIRLFVERAQAAHPRFRLTAANATAVAQISRTLEGMPLAIELAASRTTVLTPAQIAERLSDALQLLNEGSRTAPPRQSSLRATLDWSYALLTTDEQRLLRRLSAFAGGCTLDAAEAVCTDATLPAPGMLEVLAHLIDKSLVEVDERGEEARYRLLEPVRQYAAAQLEAAGETDAIRARHLDWHARFCEQIHRDMVQTTDRRRLVQFEALRRRELDNLRLALGWSLSDQARHAARVTIGVRLVRALHQFWQAGRLSEGLSWVEQLITASRDHTVEPSLRVLLYHQAGMYARRIGQHQRGKVFYDEELQLARQLGDRGAMDYGLWGLGSVARELGDYERAAEYFEEALAIGRAMQDTTRIAEDLTNLGDTFVRMAAYERAVPVLEEAVTIARRNANALRLTEALAELAAALTGLGQRQAARACAEESLALSRDLEAAWDAAMALSKLGLISLRDGAPDWAAALWSESLQQFYTMGEQPRVAREIEHLAYAAHTLGQFERAARLLGAAEALRDALGIPLWPADQPDHDFAVAETHLALGSEAALAASWAAGRAMPAEGVVADALGTAAL